MFIYFATLRGCPCNDSRIYYVASQWISFDSVKLLYDQAFINSMNISKGRDESEKVFGLVY